MYKGNRSGYFSKMDDQVSPLLKKNSEKHSTEKLTPRDEDAMEKAVATTDPVIDGDEGNFINRIMGCFGFFDSLPRSTKLVLAFIGLQVSYVTWGVVQEQLMNNEYKPGRFQSSTFCVFGNRFLALFVSFGIVLAKKFGSSKPLKEAPYYWYAPSSISNSVSSWAQYEALKYVSFPTQVLSKSCKIIPVMIVSVSQLLPFSLAIIMSFAFRLVFC